MNGLIAVLIIASIAPAIAQNEILGLWCNEYSKVSTEDSPIKLHSSSLHLWATDANRREAYIIEKVGVDQVIMHGVDVIPEIITRPRRGGIDTIYAVTINFTLKRCVHQLINGTHLNVYMNERDDGCIVTALYRTLNHRSGQKYRDNLLPIEYSFNESKHKGVGSRGTPAENNYRRYDYTYYWKSVGHLIFAKEIGDQCAQAVKNMATLKDEYDNMPGLVDGKWISADSSDTVSYEFSYGADSYRQRIARDEQAPTDLIGSPLGAGKLRSNPLSLIDRLLISHEYWAINAKNRCILSKTFLPVDDSTKTELLKIDNDLRSIRATIGVYDSYIFSMEQARDALSQQLENQEEREMAVWNNNRKLIPRLGMAQSGIHSIIYDKVDKDINEALHIYDCRLRSSCSPSMGGRYTDEKQYSLPLGLVAIAENRQNDLITTKDMFLSGGQGEYDPSRFVSIAQYDSIASAIRSVLDTASNNISLAQNYFHNIPGTNTRNVQVLARSHDCVRDIVSNLVPSSLLKSHSVVRTRAIHVDPDARMGLLLAAHTVYQMNGTKYVDEYDGDDVLDALSEQSRFAITANHQLGCIIRERGVVSAKEKRGYTNNEEMVDALVDYDYDDSLDYYYNAIREGRGSQVIEMVTEYQQLWSISFSSLLSRIVDSLGVYIKISKEGRSSLEQYASQLVQRKKDIDEWMKMDSALNRVSTNRLFDISISDEELPHRTNMVGVSLCEYERLKQEHASSTGYGTWSSDVSRRLFAEATNNAYSADYRNVYDGNGTLRIMVVETKAKQPALFVAFDAVSAGLGKEYNGRVGVYGPGPDWSKGARNDLPLVYFDYRTSAYPKRWEVADSPWECLKSTVTYVCSIESEGSYYALEYLYDLKKY